MALSRLTAWVANQILTRNALVAEFDNIYNNSLSLISPLTGNLNAALKQITNLLFETQASTQSAATEGRVYYQTTEDQIHVDDGSAIRRVPTISSPTRGGLIKVGSTASVMDQLAIGSAGKVLRSDGTDPAYSTFTIPNTYVAGDVLYASATNVLTALAKGTALQVLRMNSGATVPEWGAGGLMWVGGSDVEGTTTSTSLADVVTISGLSIAVTSPILIVCSLRKSTGAANVSKWAVTLNSTNVGPDVTWSAGTDAVDSGQGIMIVTPHDATYLRTAYALTGGGVTPVGLAANTGISVPNATITSVKIQMRSGDGAITSGCQYVRVYTLAVA